MRNNIIASNYNHHFRLFQQASKTLVFEHYRRLADKPNNKSHHYDLPADRIILNRASENRSIKMNFNGKNSAEERQDVVYGDSDGLADELRSLAVGTGDSTKSTTTDRTANGRSPVCVTANGFVTPVKKVAPTKTWLDYRLSPMKNGTDVDYAIAEARSDGFLEREIHPRKFRLILFLYGTGFVEIDRYYTDQDRIGEISEERKREIHEERRNEIMEFLKDKETKRRLMLIAFSPPSDTVPKALFKSKHEAFFEQYFKFATTCDHLFHNNKSTVGFLDLPYYRIQHSKNCYIVAVAVFLYLTLRKQNPNQKPIDIGWLARHYVTNTLELLKHRVIQNKGGGTKQLLESILGDFCNRKEEGVAPVRYFKCEKDDPMFEDLGEKTQECMIKCLDKGFYGLVTVWITSKQFRAIQNNDDVRKKKCYVKFDGPHDCEAQIVEFDTAEEEEWREYYKKNWEREINSVTSIEVDYPNEEDEDIDNQKRTADEEDGSNDSPSNEVGTKPPVVEHGRHAMALLGSIKDEQGKTFFVLLNWWPGLPLVVVSYEYMVASSCELCFILRDLPPNILKEPPKTCGLLGAECCHPDYEGECYDDNVIVE